MYVIVTPRTQKFGPSVGQKHQWEYECVDLRVQYQQVHFSTLGGCSEEVVEDFLSLVP